MSKYFTEKEMSNVWAIQMYVAHFLLSEISCHLSTARMSRKQLEPCHKAKALYICNLLTHTFMGNHFCLLLLISSFKKRDSPAEKHIPMRLIMHFLWCSRGFLSFLQSLVWVSMEVSVNFTRWYFLRKPHVSLPPPGFMIKWTLRCTPLLNYNSCDCRIAITTPIRPSD